MTKEEMINEVKELQEKLESLYFSKEKDDDIEKTITEVRHKINLLREIRNISFFKEVLDDDNKQS